MPKRVFDTLESDRVRLRLLTEDDLPLTLAWRNRDDVRKWFFYSDVITPGEHRAWFEKYLERDDDFVFIIEEKQKANRPVGQVALYHVDWQTRRAEFGRFIIGERDARGSGLAQDAMNLIVRAALTKLGLEEVYLEVYENNEAALMVYNDCGFRPTASHDGILTMVKERTHPSS